MTPLTLDAVRLSLEAGLFCAVLGFPPALALGWLLARRDFPGKSALGALIMAPLVLPPVVTGILLLKVFGTKAPLGGLLAALGLPAPFHMTGVVLASLTASLPLYILSARLAFESADARFDEAAATLGIPPTAVFRRVTWPLAAPGLAAGAVIAFARGLGEFGATIVLAGNVPGRTRTIPLAVYSLLDAPAGGSTQPRALVLASLALSFGALAAFECLCRRQDRRLGLRRG
ncbi:MAG: molybdate ABC transporter permease subunit [Elusimicrobia bacterium]|nr:molybdate ABC transporter permease subunit [Elusimicrobiota bacterium]